MHPVRRLTCITALALLTCLVSTRQPHAQSDFVRGDWNCDGVVDILDTSWVSPANPCQDARDLNDDGLISTSDYLYQVNFLTKGGPPPPAPYPDCGPDPTPDGLVCDSACCGGSSVCPVAITGDVNIDGVINSADIINLVSFVFKSGNPPQPCNAAGDVNCSSTVSSADIIALVNYVFKGGEAPCDACTGSALAADC
jgi:hypothetical protein